MITLTIPDCPPGLNKLLRMSRFRRAALQKLWRRWIWAARCQARLGPPTPPQRAKVSIHRTGVKLLDKDNLYGGVGKIICDALKANQFIMDDSPKHIELTCTQEVGVVGVRVTVEGG